MKRMGRTTLKRRSGGHRAWPEPEPGLEGGSDSQARQEARQLQRAVAPGPADIVVSVTAC